jgi:hypothetical protein
MLALVAGLAAGAAFSACTGGGSACPTPSFDDFPNGSWTAEYASMSDDETASVTLEGDVLEIRYVVGDQEVVEVYAIGERLNFD